MKKKVKQKTKKSIIRRIKVTGSGKLIRRQSFNRHLKSKKSRSRTRRLDRPVIIEGTLKKKIKKVLGI